MEFNLIKEFLLWSFLINFGILLFWFGFLALARDWVYRMHTIFLKLSPEKFDEIHYMGTLFYKTIIFVFFVVPYLVLLIIT